MFADLEAPALSARTFLVEDFLPERIDFDLTLADAPLALGSPPVDLTVAARYLFGAPGAGLAIEGEVLLRAAEGCQRSRALSSVAMTSPSAPRWPRLTGPRRMRRAMPCCRSPCPPFRTPSARLKRG
jgi:hypothetical protein